MGTENKQVQTGLLISHTGADSDDENFTRLRLLLLRHTQRVVRCVKSCARRSQSA